MINLTLIFLFLRKTIHTGIPNDEKAAYLEAVEKAPKVVEMETDALQFVRSVKLLF